MTQVKKFLNQHTVGMIIRTFATDSDRVADRVEMVTTMIKKALAVQVLDGKSVFRCIDVVVPMDPRYPADCGETMPLLKERVKSDPLMCGKVHVTEIHRGDLFCEVLNRAVGIQLKRGIHYSCIISPEVHSNMNQATMVAVLEKAAAGSLATGVAINELKDSVYDDGEIANTFALWENVAFVQAGCFNLKAAMPIDDKSATCYVTRDSKSGELVYNKAMGVEEIITLLNIVLSNSGKPCIAAVLPQGKDFKEYHLPPVGPELDRHNAKMNSKKERKEAMAAHVNCDLSILRGALIK